MKVWCVMAISSLCLILFSCNSNRVFSKEEIIAYVDDTRNGFIQTKEVGELKFAAKYLPTDYLVAKSDLTGDSSKEDMRFAFRISDIDARKDFLMDYANDANDFTKILDYLSYQSASNFQLITDRDTINALNCTFINTYNLAPYVEFVVVFDYAARKSSNDFSFVYQDVVFDKGPIRMNFSGKVLDIKLDKK